MRRAAPFTPEAAAPRGGREEHGGDAESDAHDDGVASSLRQLGGVVDRKRLPVCHHQVLRDARAQSAAPRRELLGGRGDGVGARDQRLLELPERVEVPGAQHEGLLADGVRPHAQRAAAQGLREGDAVGGGLLPVVQALQGQCISGDENEFYR